jgi:hypothetical protein
VSKGAAAILGRACLALLLAALWAPAASAIPGYGPHSTVDGTTTTTQPNSSAGLGYAARYHAANDPDGDPPALRHLTIELPPGSRSDTSVPGRCAASDMQIMLQGESACPPSARVGSGEATLKQLGAGVSTYPTVLYNAEDQQLELVMSGDRVVAVVHTYIHGTTLEGPVPTCITGGNPPDGCPFDQLTLLANHLETVPISRGGRNYGTTPPTCPKSGRWRTRVKLYFGDGSVDDVITEAPCSRSRRKKRAGPVDARRTTFGRGN